MHLKNYGGGTKSQPKIFQMSKSHTWSERGTKVIGLYLEKNQNAPRPSEHPPVREEKGQNV